MCIRDSSNGVCILDHNSYLDAGCIVMSSSEMADYLDAAFTFVFSDTYGDPNASFPSIEASLIASGPDACGEYLRVGGQRSYRASAERDNETRVYVTRNIDGEFMWVDEETGEVLRSTGIFIDQSPADE